MDLRKEDKEEEARIPQIVRSARFLESDDGWFFRTREGIMLGPYETKFDAELSASLLVARLAQLDEGKDPARVIRAFETDPANATMSNVQRNKPVDLDAIRKRHQLENSIPTLRKAWNAISRLKTIPRPAGPKSETRVVKPG